MAKFDDQERKRLHAKMMRPSVMPVECYELGLKHPFRILLVEDLLGPPPPFAFLLSSLRL